MAVERVVESRESQSLLNSRLFRAGLLITAAGILYAGFTGSWKLAAVGVGWTGAAWAWWKGKK